MFDFKKAVMFLLIVLLIVQATSLNFVNVLAETGNKIVYGDLNGDSSVNSLDLVYMRKYILGMIKEFPYENGIIAADLDGNEAVNSIDYAWLKKYLLGKTKDFPVNSLPSTQPTPISIELNTDNLTSYKYLDMPLGNFIAKVTSEYPVSYSWRIISQPSGSNALIDNTFVENPNFTADTAGDYVLGLTASYHSASSDEKILTVKVEEFGDTTDDIDVNAITEKSLTGYDFKDYTPLSDGWIIAKDKTQNKVIFVNVFTGTHGKEFIVDGTPDKMEFDFERELLLVSLGDANAVAKIDLRTQKITYINIEDNIMDMTFGEKGTAFVLAGKDSNKTIYVVDVIKNEIKNSINLRGYYGSMVYEKSGDQLIIAGLGTSPSELSRYAFDETAYDLKLLQTSTELGSNGQDLAISNDGKHIAFSCGGGNGKEGYTLFDIDSSDITNKFGEWSVGFYPTSADFSLDNKYLVASNSFVLKIFDVETHDEVGVIGKTAGSNDNVSFSRGGKIVYDAEEELLLVYRSGITQAEVVPPQVLKRPTAYTVSDKMALKDLRLTLDGSSSDKGSGTYLEYKWEMVSKPESSQSIIEDEDSSIAKFVPDMVGQYCISLKVFNEAGESETAFVNITVQDIKDTTDIIGNIESGYIDRLLPIKPIALPSGWIVTADTDNAIKIINVLNMEVIAKYQVSGKPNKLSFDFENNRIVASLEDTNSIVVIDVEKDTVYYIETPYSYKGIAYGEGDIAFAITKAWTSGYISVIDIKEKKVLNSIEVKVYEAGLIEYDPNYNNLFFADSANVPSKLYRYSFDEVTKELKPEQIINNAGGNAKDLSISNDGKHLVLCCGGGNGEGYTIFDFNATDLEEIYGEFDTGSYPRTGAFSNDGNYFVAFNGKKLLLFDANGYTLIDTITSNLEDVTFHKVVFSRGDNLIYCVEEDRIYYFTNPLY